MSYDTVINKCRDIEKLAQTPAEKSFLQTASIFFLEVDQAELVHGEGIRKEFIRDVILALGNIDFTSPQLLEKEYNMQVSAQNDFNKISSLVGKGDLFPAWRGKAEQALLVMYVGQSLGLNWFYSLTNITVINGRPVVWGDAMMALCQRSTCMEYCHETFDEQTMTATCEVKRVGCPAQTRKFSQKEAEKAGLWTRGPWRSYPQRMLQMRARGFALRDVFADVLQGIGMAEEVQDYEVEQQSVDHIAEQPAKSAQLLQKGQFAKLEEVVDAQEVQENQQSQEDRDEIEEPVESRPSDLTTDVPPTAFAIKRDTVLEKIVNMGTTVSKILASLELESVEEIDASNLEHLINIGKGIKEGKGTINQAFC